MVTLFRLVLLAISLPAVFALSNPHRTIWDLKKSSWLAKRDDSYPEYYFKTPIDHFHNESRYEPHTNETYAMRYWFSAEYYKPGGPVIVLQSGETDASGRLVFLQKGILHRLAKATNGIGVVMEHRYYGKSFPTPNLSTKNLRFLTTQQALADAAYFAQNIKFPGLEDQDLTSKSTAYIGYGGSYSGGFNAFLRKLYPNVYWGTISSSGVTVAIWDYWQYYEPVAEYAPPQCIATQRVLTNIADRILFKNNTKLTKELKEAFGMPNVTYDDDFANQLSNGIGTWQSLNWDPQVASYEFYRYCDNITATHVMHPGSEKLRSKATHLIKEAGYPANKSLVNQMLNYIAYVNLTTVIPCSEEGMTQDECFTKRNETFYRQDGLEEFDWRSWAWQYCTEWGYQQTGSGVPKNELPLISRTLDMDYMMVVCNDAFGIYGPPNVTQINQYGGYDISYPRLALIDGEWDPWRPAGPHGFDHGAKPRPNKPSEPFILIPKAVHHWDENGRLPNETTSTLPPKRIKDTQHAEVEFVKEWMREYHTRSY